MDWQLIVGEVLSVMNLGFWFLGMLVCICGPILVGYMFYTSMGIDIGENRSCESSIYDREDMPATAAMLAGEVEPVVKILDKCKGHRSKLDHYYRQLCQRVGVEPGARTPMDDLIAEAVFDGRRTRQCIFEVELASVPSKEHQHA